MLLATTEEGFEVILEVVELEEGGRGILGLLELNCGGGGVALAVRRLG